MEEKPISVRKIPEEDIRFLERLAGREDRSVSSLIRIAIKEFIDRKREEQRREGG